MPADRYFTKDSLAQATIELHDKEQAHLSKVMRASTGDSIELINGQGQLAQGRILSISKSSATIEIVSFIQAPQPSFRQIIYQGIPRQNRLDTIMEKCTELGMTDLRLFPATKSERVDLNENQLERCEHVLIAAMKQSGSLWLPNLTLLPPISEWKSLPNPSFHGEFSPKARLLSVALRELNPQTEAAIIIGPESGLTSKEEKKLIALGSQGIKLHTNILRTDTAPIVALSLLNGWLMESATL
jgi:16S rRNA (uracil1498-N3)-methyltransferase